VLKLINISLINCPGTNSSTSMDTEFLSVKIAFISKAERNRFSGFFSQLPGTQVLKFCPELETLALVENPVAPFLSFLLVDNVKILKAFFIILLQW